jgi:hypothetical protein
MATPPEGLRPLYARVVDPTRGGRLDERSLGELRTMRTDCEQAEAAVSFTRRVLHGRLDLLASEEERRREPAPADPPDLPALATASTAASRQQLPELLQRLHTVLAAQSWPARPRPRRLVVTPAPECVQDDLLQLVDDVAGPAVLTELSGQSDEQMAELRRGFQRLERELSALRRELHIAIDNLHGEVRRRYRSGEATVERFLE